MNAFLSNQRESSTTNAGGSCARNACTGTRTASLWGSEAVLQDIRGGCGIGQRHETQLTSHLTSIMRNQIRRKYMTLTGFMRDHTPNIIQLLSPQIKINVVYFIYIYINHEDDIVYKKCIFNYYLNSKVFIYHSSVCCDLEFMHYYCIYCNSKLSLTLKSDWLILVVGRYRR